MNEVRATILSGGLLSGTITLFAFFGLIMDGFDEPPLGKQIYLSAILLCLFITLAHFGFQNRIGQWVILIGHGIYFSISSVLLVASIYFFITEGMDRVGLGTIGILLVVLGMLTAPIFGSGAILLKFRKIMDTEL